MQLYKDFRPTALDTSGLALDERQDWLVFPHSRTRDSGCLAESNFHVALKSLGGKSETVEVHRFGHWGPGWFEIILIDPKDEARVKDANEMIGALANYPVLDDEDHSRREQEAADLAWKNCYGDKERIEYIRDHRSQFEFRSFSDMLACVRGKFFAGYASEMCDG